MQRFPYEFSSNVYIMHLNENSFLLAVFMLSMGVAFGFGTQCCMFGSHVLFYFSFLS